MDKYNSCQRGIWNKDGLRDVNCLKTEQLTVKVPDLKSYQGLFSALYYTYLTMYVISINKVII